MARRAIGDDETSVEVERALWPSSAPASSSTSSRRSPTGRAIETPQDASLATYAAKITKAEGAVDWSLPAERIHNLVRGLQPWPLVSARLGGARILIHRTALTVGHQTRMPRGRSCAPRPDRFEVVAGDGHVLRLLSIQPEGRRAMTAREFLAGRHVAPGAKVERG